MNNQTAMTVERLKQGAMMGLAVGLTMGFCFGGFTVLRYGPGPKGYLRTVGQYMINSGASFAFFLG